MSFEEFVAMAKDGQIHRLHVESTGPEAYRYRAYMGEESICLLDDDGSPLQEKCLGHARQRLRAAGDISNIPLYLVQYAEQVDDLAASMPRLTHRVPFAVG